MPGRFLLRRAKSGVEKLKASSEHEQKLTCDALWHYGIIVAKSPNTCCSCPPAPVLAAQPTCPEPLVPQSPLQEIQIACTTGPAQLRSVLPPSTKRSRSIENVEAESGSNSSASGSSSGSNGGSLRPLFTHTVLVLPSSPQQPASSPFLHMDSEEGDENDAASDNIDLPFLLEEDDHPTPCHSILATPVFPSPAHSSQSHLSNVATFGSLSCECDPECIDPSLCASFFSVGSSYHHPLYASASTSAQYDFQPPSESSYRYINLSQRSSSRVAYTQEADVEDSGCSWAASPPQAGCSWAASPPARTSAAMFATSSTSFSKSEGLSRSCNDNAPASYATSLSSYSHSRSDDALDTEAEEEEEEEEEYDADDHEEHHAQAGHRSNNSAAPGLAGLLQQCSSLMDSDNRPSLSSFGIDMNHPSLSSSSNSTRDSSSSGPGGFVLSVSEQEREGIKNNHDDHSILPMPAKIKRHTTKVVERGFQPVRLPITSTSNNSSISKEAFTRRLSPIMEF
ncbi:hypothetical protein IAU59_000746 [Kwoniella sp. CBS 9459]